MNDEIEKLDTGNAKDITENSNLVNSNLQQSIMKILNRHKVSR